MKKVILAFDGAHFSEGAFEFARQLNEKQRILLTGVFLPQVSYANLWSYASPTPGTLSIPLVEESDQQAVEKNIAQFESRCRENVIDYSVHKDFFNLALPELADETRFADLAVLGSETFYVNLGAEKPNEYLKDILHAAECPVMVVPERFHFPTSNILAYDGSESSVFAIKQFAYMFPSFLYNETLLVTVQKEDSRPIPHEQYMEELVSRHFPRLAVLKLKKDRQKDFAAWLHGKKNPVIVTGAFGRSFFSQLFKKSFISEVIREHRLPVFITHR